MNVWKKASHDYGDEPYNSLVLDIDMNCIAAHVGRWRNRDDRAEWNSWVVNYMGSSEPEFYDPQISEAGIKDIVLREVVSRLLLQAQALVKYPDLKEVEDA